MADNRCRWIHFVSLVIAMVSAQPQARMRLRKVRYAHNNHGVALFPSRFHSTRRQSFSRPYYQTSTSILQNPPRSSFGDMISSIFGGDASSSNGVRGDDLNSLPKVRDEGILQWGALTQLLSNISKSEYSGMTEEDPARSKLAQSRSKVRLFDAPDESHIRVTLYRDSSSWCPYCEKVWLLLEEKRIPYRIEFVPMSCYGRKPAEFLQIQPSGGIPVAIIDGNVISESNDILFQLEAIFKDKKPMIPEGGSEAGKEFQNMMRTERKIFSAWFQWLVTGFGEQQFLEAADQTNKALLRFKDGPYFLGEQMSMIDCMFAPFLERMAASVPYYKGIVFRGNSRWPEINKWFDAMEARDSFRGIQSDYYSHNHDLPPQVGGCRSQGDYKKFQDEIDGALDSWQLPLSDAGETEPVRPTDRDQRYARVEAARRLINNHKNIIEFSTRALGEPGQRVMAPKADPYRKSEPRASETVDVALRLTAEALLATERNPSNDYPENIIEKIRSTNLSPSVTEECLSYLRDRVGVPRDMNFAQARQLRAHLNLVIDSVTSP